MIEQYTCPKCGAIRYNASSAIVKDGYKEIHLFCRQCETEIVIKEEIPVDKTES